MLVKAHLPPKDGQLASTLAAADEAGQSAYFLASMLFIWHAGQIPRVRREIVKSTAFRDAIVSIGDQGPLGRLLHDIAQGGELLSRSRSHHAKRALVLAQGRTFIFLDRCFLEWGVHHFHVYPNARKRDLLVYAAFDERQAYLLALGGHSTLNDSILVDAMAEVCPHLLTVLKGVRGDSFTPKELNNLRSKNAGSVTASVHGAVAPRIPYSASGLPFQVVTNVDYEFSCLDELQAILDNPAAEQYRSIQQALGTSQPLVLSVVPREANFAGSITFIDRECGKELHLTYR